MNSVPEWTSSIVLVLFFIWLARIVGADSVQRLRSAIGSTQRSQRTSVTATRIERGPAGRILFVKQRDALDSHIVLAADDEPIPPKSSALCGQPPGDEHGWHDVSGVSLDSNLCDVCRYRAYRA